MSLIAVWRSEASRLDEAKETHHLRQRVVVLVTGAIRIPPARLGRQLLRAVSLDGRDDQQPVTAALGQADGDARRGRCRYGRGSQDQAR